MSFKIVFVTIPDSLNGDPYQPSSVQSPGSTVTVGSIDLAGDDVNDPTLDPQIEVATATVQSMEVQAKMIKAISPTFTGLDESLQKLKDNKAALEAQKAEGYQLIRTQWYEAIGTSTVSYDDSQTKEIEITLGTEEETSHSTSSTVGMEFGTSTTDADSASMNVGLEFEGISVGGGTESSHSTTTSENISNELQVSASSSSIQSSSNVSSVSYTANGGDMGARYVIWQIVDRIRLIRKSDSVVLSDMQVRSYTQTSKYEYESQH